MYEPQLPQIQETDMWYDDTPDAVIDPTNKDPLKLEGLVDSTHVIGLSLFGLDLSLPDITNSEEPKYVVEYEANFVVYGAIQIEPYEIATLVETQSANDDSGYETIETELEAA